MQELITLECTQCKHRNYISTKNKKKHTERLQLKKYCKFEKKHVLHREIK